MTQAVAYSRYLGLLRLLAAALPTQLAYPLARRWGTRTSPRILERAQVLQHFSTVAPALGHIDPETFWTSYLSNATVNHLSTYLYRSMDAGQIGRRITVSGTEHLAAAHARGKGVLLLTGHQHHLVALGVSVGLQGFPTSPILMDPAATTPDFLADYMERLVADSEQHYNGGRYILVDYQTRSVRALYRAFAAGHVVPSANDFPSDLAPKRRIRLPFLGRSLSCPTGSIEVALAQDAEFVTGFMRWRGRDRFHLAIEPLGSARQVEDIAAAYVAALERAVHTDPGGWEGWKWPALFT